MKKYPIYDIRVDWTYEDDEPCWCQKKNPGGPKCGWCKDLPEGIKQNGTQYYKMYKEKRTNEEIREETLEWWKKFSNKGKNSSEPEIKIEFKEYETWCLDWFSHWTFDEGQSDSEIMISFASFVDRKMTLNRENDREESYHLMGAEDSWRWHGKTDDGETNTEPPCRCKHCKEQGLIRIGH